MDLQELIEIILGALLVVAVIVAIGFFFRDQVIGFFKGFSVGKQTGIFLAMIK